MGTEMMNRFYKLLCWLGFHKIAGGYSVKGEGWIPEHCARCNMTSMEDRAR